MPKLLTLSPELLALAKDLELFEASKSIANTGTGSRREGEHFEHLLADLWQGFALLCVTAGADSVLITNGPRNYEVLTLQGRQIVVPAKKAAKATIADHPSSRWLDVIFAVDDIVAAYPGTTEAAKRYAPSQGPYSGANYIGMYSGLSTKFDDTVLKIEGNVLVEKILMEYKTAKSSEGRQIDGNAHERLSFQVMQYLEIATKYPRCSMMVITNGAFSRYRNKYHVSFHAQADRLRAFGWFSMTHASESNEYALFFNNLLAWLQGAKA